MYTLTPETDKPLPHVNPIFPTSPFSTNNRQEPDFSENAVDASPSGSIWAIVLTLVASALNGQRLRLARRGPLEQCWLLTNYRLSTINSSCLASHWLFGHWHQPGPATKFPDYLLIHYSQALPHYGQPYYFVPCSQKSACHPFITEVTFPLKTSGDWHPLQLLKNGHCT